MHCSRECGDPKVLKVPKLEKLRKLNTISEKSHCRNGTRLDIRTRCQKAFIIFSLSHGLCCMDAVYGSLPVMVASKTQRKRTGAYPCRTITAADNTGRCGQRNSFVRSNEPLRYLVHRALASPSAILGLKRVPEFPGIVASRVQVSELWRCDGPSSLEALILLANLVALKESSGKSATQKTFWICKIAADRYFAIIDQGEPHAAMSALPARRLS